MGGAKPTPTILSLLSVMFLCIWVMAKPREGQEPGQNHTACFPEKPWFPVVKAVHLLLCNLWPYPVLVHLGWTLCPQGMKFIFFTSRGGLNAQLKSRQS